MQSKTLKITLIIMCASIICKLTGLVREISLASYLGISKFTDVYLIASAIPAELFNIVFASLGMVFLPLYAEEYEKNGNKKALEYMNNLINIMLLASVVICFLAMVFTKPFVTILALGFDSDLINVAVGYTRIMLPAIIVLGISNILSAYLQINDNFILPAVLTVPTNIVITISIFLCIYLDSTVLAYGTLIGLICQLLIQLPAVYKKGYRYKFIIRLKDIMLIKTFKMAIPVLFGTSVKKINVHIDRAIATTLCIGGVAALNYAHKIDMLIFGFFSMSFSTVIYKELSQWAAKGKILKMYENIVKSIIIYLIVLLPITVLIMHFSESIVIIIYKRGSFGDEAVTVTSAALYFYAIGIISSGIRNILIKAFYSLKNTRIPMINGVLSTLINIILSLLFAKIMGLGGIALATSISSIFTAIVLLVNMLKRMPDIISKEMANICFKVLLAIISAFSFMNCTALLITGMYTQSGVSQLVKIVVDTVLFLLIYIPLLRFMNIKELDSLFVGIKELLGDLCQIIKK